ncbi:unnamed protein product [Bursaphelenchus xylophilus]|uniref:mitogen-activated protein kinase kinase kinase n=1 Tax=Bursaphelenchus xylophilus TaxID=6326 RepID=A0A1I7RZM6_BURXY|nr:unnamed protein product [Bursaphelenchus xylophilus]CAG9111419.1 unnamed protein product [Bursaphelenchus xylophilus]
MSFTASTGTGNFGRLAGLSLPSFRPTIWYDLDEDEELNFPTPSCSSAAPGVVMRRRLAEVESDDSGEFQELVPQVGAASYDYVAMEEDELSFQRGSVVEIIETDSEDEGWVYGKIEDREGLVSKDYVSLIGRQPKEIKASEFEKQERIGSGGSCDIFAAIYRGQKVALKIPRQRRPLDNKSLEDLKREALVLARLSGHKNIVGFYGICTESSCILLELCEGRSLFQLYRRLKFAVYSTVIAWASQVAEGMNHLHNRDAALIHADLKADNILIKEIPCICEHSEEISQLRPPVYDNNDCTRCGGTHLDKLTLKITDFGISRDVKSSRHSLVGSLPWMSPEVIETQEYSKSSDVWSFGMFLVEILTNRLPFSGYDGPPMFIGDRKETPDIPEDCPPQILRLMEQCWEIEPANRPSFGEIVEMLNEAGMEDSDMSDGLDNSEYVKSTARMDVTFKKIAEELWRLINLSSHSKREFKPKAPKPAQRKAKSKAALPKGKITKEHPDPKVHFRPIGLTRQTSKSEADLSTLGKSHRQFAKRSNNDSNKDLKRLKKKARRANSSDSLNVATPQDMHTQTFRRSDPARKSNTVFYDLEDPDFSRSAFSDSQRKQRGLSKLFKILRRSPSSTGLDEFLDLSPAQEIKEDDFNASGHVDSPMSSGCQTPLAQTSYNSPLKIDIANAFDFDFSQIEKAASLPFTNKIYQTMTESDIRKYETLKPPEILAEGLRPSSLTTAPDGKPTELKQKPRSSSADPPRAVPKLPPRPPHLPPSIQKPSASESRSRDEPASESRSRNSSTSCTPEFEQPVQRRKALGQFIQAPDGVNRPPTTYIPSLRVPKAGEALKRSGSPCILPSLSGRDSPPTEQAPPPPAVTQPYLVPKIVIRSRTPPTYM